MGDLLVKGYSMLVMDAGWQWTVHSATAIDGSMARTAMDDATATQWQWRWMAMDGNGWRGGDLTAMDSTAVDMEWRERDGNGPRVQQ